MSKILSFAISIFDITTVVKSGAIEILLASSPKRPILLKWPDQLELVLD